MTGGSGDGDLGESGGGDRGMVDAEDADDVDLDEGRRGRGVYEMLARRACCRTCQLLKQ